MNDAIRVVALSGKIGVGKDYLIEKCLVPALAHHERYLVMAFADPFKLEAIVKDGVDPQKAYGDKDEKTRDMLQRRGTEEGRLKYGEDIWLRYAQQFIRLHYQRGIRWFFITDCRFPNEVQFIEQDMKGKVFRVVAPERNMDKLLAEHHGDKHKMKHAASHVSETALDEYPWRPEQIIHNDYDAPQVMAQVISDIQAHFA